MVRFRLVLGIVVFKLVVGCCGAGNISGPTKEKSKTRTVITYDVADILSKVRTVCCVPIRTHHEEDQNSDENPFGFGEAPCDETEEFDVSDFIELVIATTGGDESWQNTRSTISPRDRQLVVNATQALHVAVRRFLKEIRTPPHELDPGSSDP